MVRMGNAHPYTPAPARCVGDGVYDVPRADVGIGPYVVAVGCDSWTSALPKSDEFSLTA